ncbi:hypothetical protein SDJN03_10346, partial [Cucurbita argyrosperma subsp. sororia]
MVTVQNACVDVFYYRANCLAQQDSIYKNKERAELIGGSPVLLDGSSNIFHIDEKYQREGFGKPRTKEILCLIKQPGYRVATGAAVVPQKVTHRVTGAFDGHLSYHGISCCHQHQSPKSLWTDRPPCYQEQQNLNHDSSLSHHDNTHLGLHFPEAVTIYRNSNDTSPKIRGKDRAGHCSSIINWYKLSLPDQLHFKRNS